MAPANLNRQQQIAYDAILNFVSPDYVGDSKFFVLSGYAGTGKTYLLKSLYTDLWRYSSVYTAPTNKATKVIRKTLNTSGSCKTLYSLLGIQMVGDEDRLVLKFPNVPSDLSSYDIIYVDEASMVNRDLYDYILERSAHYKAKWIFIGDRAQIPPVGEKDSKIWKYKGPGANLTKVERYDNELLTLATHVRQQIQTYPQVQLRLLGNHSDDEGVWKYRRQNFVQCIRNAARKGLFSEIDNTKAIAWRNRTVVDLSAIVRREIFGTHADDNSWMIGDRILIGEPISIDGYQLAHVDDEGTITSSGVTYHSLYKDFQTYQLTVKLDEGNAINLTIIHPSSEAALQQRLNSMALDAKKDPHLWKAFWGLRKAFHRIRHSYALTSHRVQGSTYSNVFVDSADIMANSNSFEALRCLYVATTRATEKIVLT